MQKWWKRFVMVGTVGLAVTAGACSSSAGDDAAPAGSTASTASTAPPATVTPDAARPAVLPVGEPTDVATGLDAPWSVAFVDEVALVSERDSGRIVELGVGGATREVGTVPGVEHGGEGGLLGIAVAEGELFAYSTGSDGNRIQRFPLTGAAGSFGLGEPTTVLEGLPSAGIHNGGRLAFGPDGMLYATVGDASDPDAAQDADSLGGKILRMTPGGDVPEGNPFPDSLVWSLGHRNVQGITWTEDGTMFASEFGQNTWDELNLITPGANYGWPEVEGIAGEPGFVDPVQQWSTDQASPSGLVAIEGSLFLANLRGQVLRAVPVADPSTATELYAGEYGRLRAVVQAPDGSLWIVTNNTDGRGSPADGDDRVLRVAVG